MLKVDQKVLFHLALDAIVVFVAVVAIVVVVAVVVYYPRN